MKKVVVLCVVLGVIFIGPALGGGVYAQQKVLNIGCLGPLSGAAAPWGLDVLHGLQMRVEEINAAGGLKVGNDTYKIEVYNYDTKARADEATTVAKKLIFGDKVKYIIGNAVGATCDAAQLITEPNKVLFTFICWGIKNLGPDKPYSFRELLGPLEAVPVLYDYVYKKFPNVKTVAIVNPNDTSGWDSAKGGKIGAERIKIKVAADVYYERGTKDFGPFVTKLLTANPDMIDFSGSPPGDGGLLAKGLNERGYQGVKVYGAAVNADPFMKVAGEAANETYTGVGWDTEGLYVRSGVKEVAKKAKAKYGEPMGMGGITNYAAAQMIFEAMQKAGSIDVDKVIEYITTHKMDTVLGPVVIGGKGDYGINRQFLYPMVANVCRGGKILNLEEILPFELR